MQKAYRDTNQGFVGISARKQVTDFRLWGWGGGGGRGKRVKVKGVVSRQSSSFCQLLALNRYGT